MLAKNVEALDKELNELYRRQIKYYDENKMPEVKAQLVKAERAWIRYKDETCEFENISDGGPSINSIGWARCRYKMLDERVKYFKEFAP